MPTDSNALHILKNEVRRLKFGDDTNEIADERIPRIVQCSLPNKGEALARCAAEDYIDLAPPYASHSSDICASHGFNRLVDDRGFWEIVSVRGCMDRINFYSRHHIKAGLLESEAHASDACEQIDAYGSVHVWSRELPYESNVRAGQSRSLFVLGRIF